jgi:tRNA(Ile2) C34 agmatinyltransferase TiaS
MRELKPSRYDILRKGESGGLTWLEGAKNLDEANSRIRELLSRWPGEFQVMDQLTHEAIVIPEGEAEMMSVCTMKCPHCGGTACKATPQDQFKCNSCGWKL